MVIVWRAQKFPNELGGCPVGAVRWRRCAEGAHTLYLLELALQVASQGV